MYFIDKEVNSLILQLIAYYPADHRLGCCKLLVFIFVIHYIISFRIYKKFMFAILMFACCQPFALI